MENDTKLALATVILGILRLYKISPGSHFALIFRLLYNTLLLFNNILLLLLCVCLFGSITRAKNACLLFFPRNVFFLLKKKPKIARCFLLKPIENKSFDLLTQFS